MGTFIIDGGKSLHGDLHPQGAKNEALQVICASFLTSDPVIIRNMPDIQDVNNLIRLLKQMGVDVQLTGDHEYIFRAQKVDIEYMLTDEFRQISSSLRGSVMILGPLLSRFGKGFIPHPGGDRIGYDIFSPRNQWVIASIGDSDKNRYFDKWPHLNGYIKKIRSEKKDLTPSSSLQ